MAKSQTADDDDIGFKSIDGSCAELGDISRSLFYEYALGQRSPKLETVKLGKRRFTTREGRRKFARDLKAMMADEGGARK